MWPAGWEHDTYHGYTRQVSKGYFYSHGLPEGEMPPENNHFYPYYPNPMAGGFQGGYYLPLDPLSDGCSDPKRPRGPGIEPKSIEDELCRICGDRASGYHYNALSCEGCKGFFRRSITKTAAYLCKYGGRCEMDMWMRRKCQACRLRRCREVGMKEECLLSEDQCKARDARRKAKTKFVPKLELEMPDSVVHSSDLETVHLLPDPDTKPSLMGPPSSAESSSSGTSPSSASQECSDLTKKVCQDHSNPMGKLSQEQQELIAKLVALQDKYEFADEQSYEETLGEFDARKNDSVDSKTFMTSMASTVVVVTQLIVEFAKGLPGFLTLSKSDQITLLKSSSTEVMTIRAARCYDLDSRAIVFGNGQPCTLENMKALYEGRYSELMYEFCHSMAFNKTDNAEYAIFTAICIFSERPGLVDKTQVEKIQSQYVELLQAYETAKKRRGGSALARFMTWLADLRVISQEHSKVLIELDIKENSPDVLAIIKDLIILPPEGN